MRRTRRPVAQMGVAPALIQRHRISPGHVSSAAAFMIGAGLLGGVLLTMFSGHVAAWFDIAELAALLPVVALVLVAQALVAVPEAIHTRRMNFERLTWAHLFSYTGGYGAVSISLAYSGFGYWSLVGGALAQSLIYCAMLANPIRSIRLSDCRAYHLWDLLAFGGGYSLARLFNAIALQVDNVIVAKLLGPGALGIYGRAYQIVVLPSKVYARIVDKVLFPAVSKVQDKPDRVVWAHESAMRLTAAAGLPAALTVAVLAPEIVEVLLGSEWKEVIVPLQIMAAAIYFRVGYKASMTILKATGYVYHQAAIQGVYAIMVFLGAYGGAAYGITGVAIGVTLAIMANYCTIVLFTLSVTKLTVKNYLKTFCPGAILSVLTFLMLSPALVVRPHISPHATLVVGAAAGAFAALAAIRFRHRLAGAIVRAQ
jgi:O-antigen/teichoic acid export membrane protein